MMWIVFLGFLTLKIKFMCTFISIFLCILVNRGPLLLTSSRHIEVLKMKCYPKILNVTCQDDITKGQIRKRKTAMFGSHDSLFSILNRRKMIWYGDVMRSGLAKTLLWGIACDIIADFAGLQHHSEFELLSSYYIHFQTNTLGKGINLLIPLC